MKYVKSNDNGKLEEFFWLFGTIASVAVPLIICFFYGGIISFIVSAVSVLIGIAVGLTTYLFPRQAVFCTVFHTDQEITHPTDRQNNRAEKNWLNNYPKISVR